LSQHNLDMDLTPDACFFTGPSETFVFDSSTSREKLLDDLDDIDDISRIFAFNRGRREARTMTHGRPSSSGHTRIGIQIIERQDKDFVAFYTSEDGLTMVVARDVSALEFRIVYKVLQDKITSSST
jgi:hypothetical protein